MKTTSITRMTMAATILVTALIISATIGSAASFDCSAARSRIDRLICSTPTLSELDDRLGAAYVAALSRADDPEKLRVEQRAWLSQRNACGEGACMVGAYVQRLAQLQEIASGRALPQGRNLSDTNTPETNCDFLAAHPFDPQKVSRGISYGALNPVNAIQACNTAISIHPNEGRLHFQLGRALEKANQLPQAIAAYERAALMGHAGGYNNLGELYRDGKGVARNPRRAEEHFREAAAKGFPEAQFSLANLLLAQSRSAENVEQARQLLQAAANSGYVAANGILIPTLVTVDSRRGFPDAARM